MYILTCNDNKTKKNIKYKLYIFSFFNKRKQQGHKFIVCLIKGYVIYFLKIKEKENHLCK